MDFIFRFEDRFMKALSLIAFLLIAIVPMLLIAVELYIAAQSTLHLFSGEATVLDGTSWNSLINLVLILTSIGVVSSLYRKMYTQGDNKVELGPVPFIYLMAGMVSGVTASVWVLIAGITDGLIEGGLAYGFTIAVLVLSAIGIRDMVRSQGGVHA